MESRIDVSFHSSSGRQICLMVNSTMSMIMSGSPWWYGATVLFRWYETGCSARDAAGAAMKTGVRARSLGEGGIFLRHVGATVTVGDTNHDGTMR